MFIGIENSLVARNSSAQNVGIDAYTKAYIKFSGVNGATTTPEIRQGKTLTLSGGATVTTSDYKFNGSSGDFNGSATSRANLEASANYTMDTAAWTVSCWVIFDDVAARQFIWAKNNVGVALRCWLEFESNTFKFGIIGAGAITAAWTPVTGRWYHLEVGYTGTNVYGFIDGFRVINNSSLGTGINDTDTDQFVFGIQDGAAENLNGRIDNWKLDIGIVRNTEDFVPSGVPTAASADFNFTGGTLPSGVTHSRASNAMMFDSQGRLVWAPANNLLNTDDFGTGWTHSGSTKDVAGISAPAGTAYKLIESATSAFHAITSNQGNVVAGATYTYSLYMKAAERSYGLIAFTGFFTLAAVEINLTTGALSVGTGSFLDMQSEDAGDGWWRISIRNIAATGGTSGNITLNYASNDGVWANRVYEGDGTSGVYIAAPQLELYGVDSPQPYVAATASSYYGPRLDYDPVTLSARGLLVEESRTNVALSSRNATTWTVTDVTPTLVGTDISGITNSCYLLTEGSAGTSATRIDGTVAAGSTITGSFLYKSSGGNSPTRLRVILAETTLTDGYNFWFDVSTGAVGSLTARGAGTAGRIEIISLGNSWYRCSVTCIPNGSYTAARLYIASAAADGNTTRVNNSTYIVDHAQIEVGSYMSSIIPTFGASSIRAVDTATTLTADWLTEVGTLFGTFTPTEDRSQSRRIALLSPSGTITDSQGLVSTTLGKAQGISSSGGGGNDFGTSTSNTITSYAVNKAAIAYDGTNSSICLNGGTVAADSARTVPVFANINTMRIGQYGTATNNASNFWISRIIFYPRRLINTQLVEITT